MKTSYKAFAFAVLAAFVVALAVVPAEDASAEATVEITWDETNGLIILSSTQDITESTTLTVMDANGETVVRTNGTNYEVTVSPNWTQRTDGKYYAFDDPSGFATITSANLYKLVSTTTTYVDQTPSATPDEPVTTTYTVTVSDSEHGKVTADPVSGVSGTSVTLTVAADEGYKLATLTVGGSDVASQVADSKYTFSLTADTQVAATFAASSTPTPEPTTTYEVTYTVNDSSLGAITTDSTTTGLKTGDKVVLQIAATDGNELTALTANGEDVLAQVENGTYTVTIADKSVAVVATFTAKTTPVDPDQPTAKYKVTFPSDLTVVKADGTAVASGDEVAAGTVLTVTAAEKTGQVAKISPTLKGDDKNQYTVNRDVTFKVTYSEKEYETATLSGSVNTTGTEFSADQQVNVTGDTTLLKGSVVTVMGKLYVPAGNTLTIAAGAQLIIKGVADIQGTVVIEALDDSGSETVPAGILVAAAGGEITLSGNVTVNGLLGAMDAYTYDGASYDAAKIIVAAGSSIEVSSTGAVFGAIEVAADASLTIAGSIGTTYNGYTAGASFKVAGTLTVATDVLSNGFAVDLGESGTLSVEKAALLNGAAISVSDAGYTVYDSKNAEVVSQKNANTLVITGSAASATAAGDEWSYGVQVEGVNASASTTTTKVTTSNQSSYKGVAVGNNVHKTTLSVSGTVAASAVANYSGSSDEPTVSAYGIAIALNGANAAQVSDALTLGVNTQTVLSGTVAVKAPVTLGYTAASSTVAAQSATLSIASGASVTVSAAVDATAAPAGAKVLANDGAKKLTLSGAGVITAHDAIAVDGLNAAYYETSVRTAAGSVTTFTYTTIDSALASAADGSKITVYGSQSVTASATLPAKATLTLDSTAKQSIGAKAKDIDVQLTIANGATLTGSSDAVVTVYGTLYAEKENDVKSVVRENADPEKGIVSDVYAYQTNDKGNKVNGGWAKWTNLTTALATATSGQTVQMNKDVKLAAATTVPEGVTLDVNGHTLLVPNAIVLTVDGTLDLTEANSAVQVANKYTVADAPALTQAAGSIVLNGYVEYDTEAAAGAYYAPADMIAAVDFDGDKTYTVNGLYTIAGAYYAVDGVDYITTVANAASRIASVDDQTVALVASGSALSFSDVAFAGNNADGDVAVVNVTGPISATGVSISNAEIRFVNASNSSIEVSGADAKIALKGAVSAGTVVSSEAYGDVVAVLAITGSVADYRTTVSGTDTAVATSVAFEGTVYIIGSAAFSTDKVQIDGAVSIVKQSSASVAGAVSLGAATNDKSSSGAQLYTATEITGTLTVKDGAVVEAQAATVSGSLVVDSGSFAVKTLTVSGSIAATAVNQTSQKYTGSIAADVLYLGTDENIESARNVAKASFTSTASAAGNVSAGYAVVADGAAVPAGWTGIDSALTAAFGYVSTAYSKATTGADGYVTVYQSSTGQKEVSDIYYATTDSRFEGWVNARNVNASDVATDVVGSTGWTSVTPKIDYAIYAIQITSDGGVGYITVDGVLMKQSGNTFAITGLRAGDHVVAASAASGYDISKISLTTTDGTAVGSMTVSVSGMDSEKLTAAGYYLFEYQLVGSTTASTGGSTGGMTSEDAQKIVDAIDKNTQEIKDKETTVNVNNSDKDDDSSLTDILLVVLVILILVMAILVAYRMMRS